MARIEPEAGGAAYPVRGVSENVRRQVTRLKSSPPIVQKLYVSKKIDIVGGVYDLATGKIALV